VDAKCEARRDAFKPRARGEGERGNPCGGPVDPRARKSDKIPEDLDGWMGLQQGDPREGWFSQSGASNKAERNRAFQQAIFYFFIYQQM